MYEVTPVGRVREGRRDRENTDFWAAVECRVVLEPSFGPAALTGLDEFSHVEVIFLFDRAEERSDYAAARSSRGRDDLPEVGVFCDRGPRRPNRLGSTMCRVLEVGADYVVVRGLDALDGTPVLDIKPVMRQFLPGRVEQPGWVDTLMQDYFALPPEP